MPWDCRVQGEFQPRDLLRQVQPVRVGSRFQASQAAGPQAGPFPQTSVNTGEMDEKFLKVILEKADRLWGSPRFCKRGLLPQPITFSWSICSGAFCCCAQFESDHTLLKPSTKKCGGARDFICQNGSSSLLQLPVSHRPIVCHLAVNP